MILGKPAARDRIRGITVPGLREEDLLYRSRRDDESSTNPTIVVRSGLNCGVSLCLNGGTCMPDPVSPLGFFCMCIPSRAGEFCEKSVGGVISYFALALIITGVVLILILVLVSCCAIFGLYIKERDRLVSSLMEKGSALGFCSDECPTSQSLNPVSQSHLREHQEYSKQSRSSCNAPASKSNAQSATSSVKKSDRLSTATPSSAKQTVPGKNTKIASQWQKAGMQTYRPSGFRGTSTVRKVMPQQPSEDNWSSSDVGTTERTIPAYRAIKASSYSAKTSNDFWEIHSEREVEDHSPHLSSSSSPLTFERLMNMMHIYFEAIKTSDPVSRAGPSTVSPPGAKSCRANSPNMQSFIATAKRSDSTSSQCGSDSTNSQCGSDSTN
ncbi:uncharacterized protein LOC121331209 [Polyodon spathula]|uniref:uncharacterized protein LOC121331209 n=1 Tax=Polyodon spathula TaxID=7913 RepID=UPI001B7E231A|nr:uncharacterized protein LOC121331209 [Polyodon spathula]